MRGVVAATLGPMTSSAMCFGGKINHHMKHKKTMQMEVKEAVREATFPVYINSTGLLALRD